MELYLLFGKYYNNDLSSHWLWLPTDTNINTIMQNNISVKFGLYSNLGGSGDYINAIPEGIYLSIFASWCTLQFRFNFTTESILYIRTKYGSSPWSNWKQII